MVGTSASITRRTELASASEVLDNRKRIVVFEVCHHPTCYSACSAQMRWTPSALLARTHLSNCDLWPAVIAIGGAECVVVHVVGVCLRDAQVRSGGAFSMQCLRVPEYARSSKCAMESERT